MNLTHPQLLLPGQKTAIIAIALNDTTNIVEATAAGNLTPAMQWLFFALSVPGFYCLLVLMGRRLKRRQGVRLGWLYHLFALGLVVFLAGKLIGLTWPILYHIGWATVILGSLFLIALVDRYVWELYFKQRYNVEVPKFLAEVVRLGILLVAVFLVLRFGYDQTINGLLIAPGILVVILGFAMQDSVGNIISGLTLQVGKPYQYGDWLLIDGRYAEVIEINWRATRLRTLDDILIEIPHRQMAAQNIVNLNRPLRRHAMRISVGIEYGAPPTRVKDVLLHATANARGIAPEPKPKVYLKNFGDSSIEYEIKFWIEDHSTYFEVCDSVRTNVWYSLHRHGIRIPFPIRTVQLERPAPDKQQQVQGAARAMLRQHPLFKSFTDVQLDALLPRGQAVHFGRGEKLIHQGDNGDSMFILVDGRAEVLASRDGIQAPVGALGAGDCFGEMSLLTGERRSATVVAATDCEVVEIGKEILGKSLKENPQLLTKLGELLAKRRLETEGILSESASKAALTEIQKQYTDGFLDKLRLFFQL
ncbi:MAG: cyclic nucleotide-binding domain-containing protein [Limisphaerales bacterium]